MPRVQSLMLCSLRYTPELEALVDGGDLHSTVQERLGVETGWWLDRVQNRLCYMTYFGVFHCQYEEISSMGMLLTETQRKWVNFLKEAAKKKPPAKGLRPKVSAFRISLLLNANKKFLSNYLTLIN